MEPLQQFGTMWPDFECVIDIVCSHDGLEWSRGDGLLFDVLHEQVGNDGTARGRSICLLIEVVSKWENVERRHSSVRCMTCATGMEVLSSRVWSPFSLSSNTRRASSIGTCVKRLTTSKLISWSPWATCKTNNKANSYWCSKIAVYSPFWLYSSLHAGVGGCSSMDMHQQQWQCLPASLEECIPWHTLCRMIVVQSSCCRCLRHAISFQKG